jgi:serine protease Do
VIPNGGIVAGDIILSVDGRRVTGVEELVDLLGDYNVGDSVRLLIYRDGETKGLSAVLMGSGRAGSRSVRKSSPPHTSADWPRPEFRIAAARP